MDVRLLRHLVAIADHGSLLAAAGTLGLTPPALTKSVQRLERFLQTSLLDRDRRPARLTEAGHRAVEHGRHVLALVEELPAELRPRDPTVEGRVRVALGPLVADAMLAAIAQEAFRLAPRLRIGADLGHWAHGLELLKLGACDLFLGDVTTASADATLSVRAFPSVAILVFCRAGHPILRERAVTPAAILAYPLAANTPPAWGVRWLQDLHRRARRSVPEPQNLLRVTCDSVAALRSIVAGSDFLGFSARAGIEQDVRSGRLAVVPFATGDLRSNAGSVVVAGRRLSPATRLVREVAHGVADGLAQPRPTPP
jgi:DNA-binding transcriptional LysR family regulator